MKDFLLLEKCPLFAGISEDELESLLTCLAWREKLYQKGEIIILEGDTPTSVGIILSGNVHVIKEDFFGNRNIISSLSAGNMFGEALVCAEASVYPVSVAASEESVIIFIDYKRIVKVCSANCSFHSALIKNMLTVLARNNMWLVNKLEHVTRRSTREKALSYLLEQAKRHNSDSFEIPFNRQELADFLSVERSALSAELSKLMDEGIIIFNKSKFQLIGKGN